VACLTQLDNGQRRNRLAPVEEPPEPGGFSARETLKIARALGRANPIAIDLVEIAPIYDLSGISTRLACGVAMEMLAGVCGR
jgi:agmatinase